MNTSDPLLEHVFKRRGRGGVKYSGGLYEIYVITADGFYVTGGTTTYSRKENAEQTASSWLEGKTGLRAFVVTIEKPKPPQPSARSQNVMGDGSFI